MSVSFTGLSNIKVQRAKKQTIGTFQSADNKLKKGNLNLTVIKLNFDLTGEDMEELQTALEKSGRDYSCNTQAPDTVELYLKNVSSDDGVVPVTDSLLKMNNQDINIMRRRDLGFYTYLAALTKKMINMPELSVDQKFYINLVNEAIHNKAVYFIENLMKKIYITPVTRIPD